MLDYIQKVFDSRRTAGIELWVWPYPWAGTQKAAEELAEDAHLRRVALLLYLGEDAEHIEMPRGLIRSLASSGIEAYALYQGPENWSDPEVEARERKNLVGAVIGDLTPVLAKGKRDQERLTRETGGKFYQVAPQSAPGIAKELVSDLRRGCVLTFSPGEEKPATAYRKIDVEVAQKDWKVRHRPGYYPNQASPASGKPPTHDDGPRVPWDAFFADSIATLLQ